MSEAKEMCKYCGRDLTDLQIYERCGCQQSEHNHVYGQVEHARFTGTPHRKCTVPGCKYVSLDLNDNEDGEVNT